MVIVDELTPESVRSFVASALQAMHPKDMRLATLDEHLIPTLGSIRDQFGIPGVSQEQSLRFSDKKLMKEALANSGVRTPQFVVVSADSEPPTYDLLVARLGSPLFVKPTCGAGSHGTRLIETEAEWRAWLTVRPEDVEFEVDAFLQGTLYHVDFVVGIDSSDWCSVGEYTHPNAEFLQGGTLGSRALSPDDWATPIVRHAAVQALNALGAGTGVYHVELFLSSAGTVTFLEAAMRPPGAMVPDLYSHIYGKNIQSLGVMAQWRSDGATAIIKSIASPKRTGFGIWAWIPPAPGVVVALQAPELPPGSELSITWRCSVGDALISPEVIVERAGMLFASLANYDEERVVLNGLRHDYRPIITEGLA
ncbi:hypothetical protein CQ031_08450 [Microbacterium sp. MYb40]|nr:hypothetical protein CQ031_08450 [Microbacterium sp. MYb40]PRB21229.1 hypothetical protein CQ037_19450 [Microbacterium sp. MYb50]PRB68240.1 hypothetical protein CQ027_17730 [Microbacterium sp. MYb32]